MSSSSRGIKLSKRQREKLSEQIKDCLFFIPYSGNSAKLLNEGVVRFVKQSSRSNRIPLSENIPLKLIFLGDLFDKAIDLIIEESVEASLYAFREAPDNYKECLTRYAKSIDPSVLEKDPVIKLSLAKYNTQRYYPSDFAGTGNFKNVKKELASIISSDLERLSIACYEYANRKKKSGTPDIYTLGTFSPSRHELKLYPLSILLSVGRKSIREQDTRNMLNSEISQNTLMARSDFVAALSLETMIHELSHLVFKCTTEHRIKTHLLTRDNRRLAEEKGVSFSEAQKIVREYVSLGFGEGISNILLANKELDGLISHAIRFKLGLLYFLSVPSEVQLIRQQFVPSIKRKIKQSQILKFDSSSGEIEIEAPYVKKKHIQKYRDEFSVLDKDVLFDTQYEWQDPLSYVYQDALNKSDLRLTFRSGIVTTSDLENTLERIRSRSNYAETKYQFADQVDLADDDLLFAFEGNANILSIPFLEDPLDFMLQLVNRHELMSSRNAGIGESAGLYMMFDNDEMRIKLVYSPDAEIFFEITTGEAWFILAL